MWTSKRYCHDLLHHLQARLTTLAAPLVRTLRARLGTRLVAVHPSVIDRCSTVSLGAFASTDVFATAVSSINICSTFRFIDAPRAFICRQPFEISQAYRPPPDLDPSSAASLWLMATLRWIFVIWCPCGLRGVRLVLLGCFGCDMRMVYLHRRLLRHVPRRIRPRLYRRDIC